MDFACKPMFHTVSAVMRRPTEQLPHCTIKAMRQIVTGSCAAHILTEKDSGSFYDPLQCFPASEDIADFIVRYSPRAVDSLYELAGTRCVNLVSQEYAIVHAPLSGVLPLSFTQHTYSAIPKLYGLQDTTALEAAGILPVFSQPNLMSTGQGVLIGLIDTGIDYTQSSVSKPGRH